MSLLRDERGTVLVLVAAALVVLLGFGALTIDVGLLFLNRERLVNAADAAALAGVQFLPGDPVSAANTALYYALQNGIEPGEVTVNVSGDGRTITVSTARQVSFFLAPVLGFADTGVSAEAKARVGGVEAVWGAAPLGILEQTLEFGELYTLKVGGGCGEQGNFGALALGGHGAGNFEDNLRDGYDGWLEIGDVIETETGNMSGPTKRAIEDRISGHEGCTFDNYCQNCPRLIYVPVYRDLGEKEQGRHEVEIVGFAAFFLDGVVPGQGQESKVRGYFVEKLSSAAQGLNGTDFGLRTAKLIE
ncbi:MAG: pilus assembly protein TadG-related protein [Thermoanaerobacteraceae bacterium]|jgi:hypothetical protein|nr:pilus assembly protein TadG-related protein [Thermoanaerobacteraceae bacterium]